MQKLLILIDESTREREDKCAFIIEDRFN